MARAYSTNATGPLRRCSWKRYFASRTAARSIASIDSARARVEATRPNPASPRFRRVRETARIPAARPPNASNPTASDAPIRIAYSFAERFTS
jgi:hypothetical protein